MRRRRRGGGDLPIDDDTVDALVEASPAVTRLRKRVLDLTGRLRRRHPDATALVVSALDAATALASARRDRWVTEAFASGTVAGATRSRAATRTGRAFTMALGRQVQGLIASHAVPLPIAAVALLDVMRAMLLADGGAAESGAGHTG